MAIYIGSRYETGDIENVQVGPGSYNVAVFPKPPYTIGVPYTVVPVPGGARIDVLAQQVLGDAKQWWVLADLNPEIEDFFDIPMGTLLRIPNTPGSA